MIYKHRSRNLTLRIPTLDIFQDGPHIGPQKLSLNRFKKMDVTQSIFSNQNRVTLIGNETKTGKFTNVWELDSTHLNN